MNFFEYFSNTDNAISTVYEFFNGKYTKDEIRHKLYDIGNIEHNLRQGVCDLEVEWKTEPRNTEESVDKFYKQTENYIFDLLPWNACGMFEEKLPPIFKLIEDNNYKTIVDFGGGIGFFSLVAANKFPDRQFIYTDFMSSPQAQFAQFLFNKFSSSNVIMLDIETEFYSTITKCDLIVTLDVLEHVANLELTLDLLTNITDNIYQYNTFCAHAGAPQHINELTQVQFMNMMARRHFIFKNGDEHHMSKVYIQYDDTGKMFLQYAS